jgi:dipeptidyl aminopeptidase/acylaminoacyl peptidase
LILVPKAGTARTTDWELPMRIHGGEAARPRARRCSTLLALGSVSAMVAALQAGPAVAATPLPGDIAFASRAPAPGQTGQGHSRINVMNTDGVGVTLNPNPAGAYEDVDPAWSPDGLHIAFASNRGGNYDIYVMNANGTGVTRVTSEPRADRYPAWSPSGMLAYRGYANPTGGSQIFVARPDGSGATALPKTFGGDQPSWAPDGRRIAFTNTSASPGPVIQITDVVTHATSAITGGAGASDRFPSWAPDGSGIAFRRLDPTGQGREVWTVAPSGGTPTNLSTVLGAPARSASWSPDARNFAFVSYRDADHNQEIWLGSRDGSTPARQLTFTTWDNDEPRWANTPIASSPVPPATGHHPTGGIGGTGGTVGGGVVPGTNRAALSLSMRVRRQALGHRKALRVQVRCNQRCAVLASGSLKPRHSSKLIRLRRTRRTLVAGRWVRLNVRLGARALRSVRSSLRHHRRVRITLNATARNSAGAFTPAVVRTITLKR